MNTPLVLPAIYCMNTWCMFYTPWSPASSCCLSDAAHCFPYSIRSVYRLSTARSVVCLTSHTFLGTHSDLFTVSALHKVRLCHAGRCKVEVLCEIGGKNTNEHWVEFNLMIIYFIQRGIVEKLTIVFIGSQNFSTCHCSKLSLIKILFKLNEKREKIMVTWRSHPLHPPQTPLQSPMANVH